MFGKALGPKLVALNLVPDADTRGGAYVKGEKLDADSVKKPLRFIDNMGRLGLLPRSAPPGYPAWTLHAAAEICEKRAQGVQYKAIKLSEQFDNGWLLNDLGLAIVHCSKLATGPRILKNVLVGIMDEASTWKGVTSETALWGESALLTAAVKLGVMDPWDAFEQMKGLRRNVLDKHEDVMRQRGWLTPPAARPR